MRSILVHADHDKAKEVRLQTALDIARRLRAHLTLLIATPFRQFVAVDPFGGSYVLAEAMAKAQADDAALEAALSARLGGEDVPWDIVTADGDIVGSLAAAAAFADLAVVSLPGKPGSGVGEPSMLAGDLAIAAAAPVLALPREGGRPDLDAPVMVAWNGSGSNDSGSDLPRTGAEMTGLALGVGLLAVGAAAVIITRRRMNASDDPAEF